MRKILQCMAWNAVAKPVDQFFGEEIDYGLLRVQSLAQAQTVSDELHARTLDVDNAFTAVRTPPDWWPLLSGPLIRAGRLPIE